MLKSKNVLNPNFSLLTLQQIKFLYSLKSFNRIRFPPNFAGGWNLTQSKKHNTLLGAYIDQIHFLSKKRKWKYNTHAHIALTLVHLRTFWNRKKKVILEKKDPEYQIMKQDLSNMYSVF